MWGIYDENITSEFWDNTTDPIAWPWRAWKTETGLTLDYATNITLNPSTLGPTYGLDNITLQSAVTIFDDFFPSFYTAEDSATLPLLRYKNYPNGPWTRTLDFNP